MIPLMFTNGLLLAFTLGDYGADIICPVAGPQFTGLVLATFFTVNGFATVCWGKLITRQIFSRYMAFMLAGVAQLIFILAKTFWKHPDNYYKSGGDWVQSLC